MTASDDEYDDMPGYDTCEFKLKGVVPFKQGILGFGRQKATCVFAAVASGPHGEYETGRSGPFEMSYLIWDVEYGYASEDVVATTNRYRQLTASLAAEGWEPTGRTSRWWWSAGFRRPTGQ